MNKYIILSLFLGLFFSCQEEIDYEEDQFKRIIGFEGSSVVTQILELENNDLLMVGKMGVSAHDLTSTQVGIEIDEVEDQGPFIAITDPNGYVKKINSYPLEEFSTIEEIEVLNMPNKLTFIDIMKNPNGGYHVLAELIGFDFRIKIPEIGLDSIMISTPSFRQRTPFLYELDENLQVTKIISFNASEGWDFIARNKPIMKPVSDDEFIIMFSEKSTIIPSAIKGYSFLHLNHQLDTIGFYENFDSNAEKFAYDFVIHDDKISVLASDSGAFYLFEHERQNQFKVSKTKFVNQDGQSGRNTNPHYLKTLNDGNLLAVYTDPFNTIRGDIYSPDFSLANRFEFAGSIKNSYTVRAPRALTLMQNGDILLYSIFIPDNNDDALSGQVIRTKPSGETVFNLKITGSPGDILQLADGNILFASNAVHNELLQRITLYKISEDGTLF